MRLACPSILFSSGFVLAHRKRTHVFRVIGQFVAKAMLDSRIIDLHFNKVFVKLVLGDEVPLTIASLKVCSIHITEDAFSSVSSPTAC